MVNATLYETKSIKELNKIHSYKYNVPNINISGTSDEYGLKVPYHDGELHTIRIACLSENYDLHIYTKMGVTSPSINEILKVIEINKEFQDVVNVIYINSDIPPVPYLYIKIINNDNVNATGVIELQVIYKTEWVE